MQNVSGIHTIQISQKNSSGHAILHADELKVPEMGYVLPYTALHAALQQALQQADVTRLYGATVGDLRSAGDGTAIGYQHQGKEHTLTRALRSSPKAAN